MDRNINKKALVFFGLTSVGVLGMVLFAWQQMQEPEEQPKPVEQTVSIPEPDLPPLPPPEPMSPVSASAASTPEVPPIAVQPAQKQEVVPVETTPVVAAPPIETFRQPETFAKPKN